MTSLTNYLLTLLFMLCLVPAALVAWDGGSAYSRYGFGELRHFGSERAVGMGGAGIAIPSATTIDEMNPAAWTRIRLTRYSLSASTQTISLSDGTRGGRLGETAFNGAMLAIPISPARGIVVGIGLLPYSSVNYNIISPATQGGYNYTLGYRGNGGLSQAQIGASWMPAADIHLGAKFNYYFGEIQHTISQTFATGVQFSNAEDERSLLLNGVGLTFGAIYSGLSDVLPIAENASLNVGVVLSTTSYLTADEERIYRFSSGGVQAIDTVTLSDQKTRIPLTIGGGVSYGTERFIIASDLLYQPWNRRESITTLAGGSRDRYRWSLGGELAPKRDPGAPFFQRTVYRAGIFYQATYYAVKGEPINELGASAGFGFPIIGETRLHIGAEYTVRGTTDNQLLKENIFRISFTLSGGELWFIRPQEE